mmetsp:Transcript_119948/g.274841  ORF Transcript_119948/g.274841 Transcript_119948/m.274841 type:complete len:115 (-) Transcript_119948:1278-1622(-)
MRISGQFQAIASPVGGAAYFQLCQQVSTTLVGWTRIFGPREIAQGAGANPARIKLDLRGWGIGFAGPAWMAHPHFAPKMDQVAVVPEVGVTSSVVQDSGRRYASASARVASCFV